ncbi:4-hydroxyphenylpyruvate dioxygenase [Actinobacteria bacterium OK074]|nr:4-hydroxyphenylpyruvate dioxygenase [Actinobacteria bacterium OK074]
MTVRDIAYAELYTYDREATVDYFCSGMGFAPIAEADEPGRSSTLLRQGDAQVVVSSGPDLAGFLDEHGDGIADLALTCDDVTLVQDTAVAAGARFLGAPHGAPVVSGFGDVRHTLIPATGFAAEGNGLPPGRPWISGSASADARQQAKTVRILDHVAVCVEGGRLAERADFYRKAFGFSRFSSEYVAVGGQAMDSIVVRSASGGVTFTMVAPDPGKEPGQLDRFLARNSGPGVQHLAFLVEDIVSAVRQFRGQGVRFLDTPDSYYDMLAGRLPDLTDRIEALRDGRILADSDEWGNLLQLFTTSPYERNTLFFELIQRQGSRGFGSANIRALYEAVERDRLSTS